MGGVTKGDQYFLPGARAAAFHGKGQVNSLGIRPEHISLAAGGQGQCDGQVEVVEYLGADTFVVCDCGEIGQLSVRVSVESDCKPGGTVALVFSPERLVSFDWHGDILWD